MTSHMAGHNQFQAHWLPPSHILDYAQFSSGLGQAPQQEVIPSSLNLR